MNKRFTTITTLCLSLGYGSIASAHPGHGTGGFAAGISHPISGVDHILAMVAVGLLAAQIGKRALWLLPTTFLGLMIVGGLLNMAGVGVPMIEQGIMASVFVQGLLIAFATRLPMIASAMLVGLFAIFHGYAHVAEMNAGHSAISYAAGFVISTATLHLAGIAIGLAARRFTSPLTIRLAGGAIALCGILLFANVL